QLAKAQIGPGNGITDIPIERTGRASHFFPVLDRAGEDVADLCDGQIGYRVGSVNDDSDAIGANDRVVELEAAFAGQPHLVHIGLSGSCGDVAVAVHQGAEAIASALEL